MKPENPKEFYKERDFGFVCNDAYYSDVVQTYNQVIRIKFLKKLFSKYLKNGASVLDLGCGSANDIINLRKVYGKSISEFTGVDLSKKTISRLKKLKIPKAEFICGDVENVEIGRKFDIILSLEVAEHLEHFDRHLEVIKNHLKPDGVLVMSTPNAKYFFRDLYGLFSKIFRIQSKRIAELKNEQKETVGEHINVMSFPDFSRQLKQKGFRITDTYRTSVLYGGDYLDSIYGLVVFLDWMLPKRIPYLGSGYIVAAKLK